MRLVGYDKAPARLPRGSGAPASSPEALADRARELCAGLGLHEIVSWGFVPRGWLAPLGARLSEGVVVKNPISADYELMRTSLLPALLDAARRNIVRGVADVGLFEVGPTVRRAADPKEAPVQTSSAAAILVGRRPGWLKPDEPVDFFDAKQIVRELLRVLGVEAPTFVPQPSTAAPPARLRCFTRASPPRSGPAAPRGTGSARSASSTRGSGASSASRLRRSIWRSRSTRSPASGARSAAWPRRGSRRRRAISRSGSMPP